MAVADGAAIQVASNAACCCHAIIVTHGCCTADAAGDRYIFNGGTIGIAKQTHIQVITRHIQVRDDEALTIEVTAVFVADGNPVADGHPVADTLAASAGKINIGGQLGVKTAVAVTVIYLLAEPPEVSGVGNFIVAVAVGVQGRLIGAADVADAVLIRVCDGSRSATDIAVRIAVVIKYAGHIFLKKRCANGAIHIVGSVFVACSLPGVQSIVTLLAVVGNGAAIDCAFVPVGGAVESP